MNLYLKYRPKNLDEVRGNVEVVSAVKGILANKSAMSHTFLFHGPTGSGKTTMARILATELGIKGFDLKEVNSSDFRGIDTVREIIKNSQFAPLESPYRMWILDEFQKMTNDAQNAILKILEDTPSHVFFVICTTEPQKLLDTIKSRCLQFQMKPLNERQMYGLLRHIVKSEGQELEREVYDQIVLDSLGLPRNALQILEQVLNVEPTQRLSVARQTAERQSQSIELCRALMSNVSWKQIARILEGLKDQDPESIRRHVLAYCRSVLLKEENDRAALIIEQFWDAFYDIGFPGLVYACYSVVRS
jgi:DNA polymerase-3 subunit gamma/tau